MNVLLVGWRLAAADFVSFTDGKNATGNIQLPITLHPSRVQSALLFIVCLLFVLIGIWTVHGGDWFGYFATGFFALGLPIFALQFYPKAAYLRLEAEGFTICVLFRRITIRWAQVRDFGVARLWGDRRVGWNFTPDYSATKRARAISRAISGCEGMLSNNYGMKPDELAELMESVRQEYADTQNA